MFEKKEFLNEYALYSNLKVTLPNKAISNNATDVSENGRELKWNIGVDGEKEIQFEFYIFNITNIITYSPNNSKFIMT